MTGIGSDLPPRRDGGMVTGGSGYTLDELLQLPLLSTHSCGIERIDAMTGGGLAAGSVWTAMGPAGIGLTTLALQLAVAASRTADVLVVNGHVPSHHLAARIRACSAHVEGDATRIKVASWKPVPVVDGSWDSEAAEQDVVIFDTWDEQWRPGTQEWHRPRGLESLRLLRELARRHNLAVLLTARVDPVLGTSAQRKAREQHRLHESFADIADIQMTLEPGPSGHREMRVSSRLGPGWAGTARVFPDRCRVLVSNGHPD